MLVAVLRIHYVYPGSWFLIHPGSDPTKTKEKEEKLSYFYLFCSHKFKKIKNYFNFEQASEKIFLPIWEFKYFLPKKLSLSYQSMGWGSGIWDPGSGENLSRIQGSKKERIQIRNSGWLTGFLHGFTENNFKVGKEKFPFKKYSALGF